MFRQRFVCSVAVHEGEFNDVRAVSEGAVRGGRLDLAYGPFGTKVTPRPEAAMASWVKIELARWRMPGLNPTSRQVAMSWSW